MNPILLTQGFSLANQLRKAMANNSPNSKRTVYDELRDSSADISDLRRYLEELESDEKLTVGDEEAKKRKEARAAAGPVTRASHVRLHNRRNRLARWKAAADFLDFEKAKDGLTSSAEEAKKSLDKTLKPWKKKAQKQSKQVQKAADKARRNAEKKISSKQAKKARKRADKAAKKANKQFGPAAVRAQRRKNQAANVGKNVGIGAAVIALLAALGAAVYWFFLRKPETPAERPPRVEEHSGKKEATLVYSSNSEDDLTADAAEAADTPAREKVAGDLAEEPAERDEELLGSIDEQLAAHREQEDAVAEAAEGAENASQQLDEETKKAQEIFDRYRDDQTK